MQMIQPKVQRLNQEPGLLGIYKAIARAGHICYASNKEGNEQEFVGRCIKSKHFRPLEFGTVFLTVDSFHQDIIKKYKINPYSKVRDKDGFSYITTNFRVIIENSWHEDLQYLDYPTEFHYKRYTFQWTIARSIADEFRTHVSISSLMESTRYCDYSKDKFNNELTFITPSWFNQVDGTIKDFIIKKFQGCEDTYFALTSNGLQAQQARILLPLDIKTEFIQCGFEDAWDNFFNQRFFGTTGAPHPDAKFIAEQAYSLYNEKFIIDQDIT